MNLNKCKYNLICKNYDECETPIIYDKSLGLSDCWRWNFFDGIIKQQNLKRLENLINSMDNQTKINEGGV